MEAWEKAKEKNKALSKMDIISMTCPDLQTIGKIKEQPKQCFRDLTAQEQCKADTTEDGIPLMCISCWEREIK